MVKSFLELNKLIKRVTGWRSRFSGKGYNIKVEMGIVTGIYLGMITLNYPQEDNKLNCGLLQWTEF